MHVKQKARTIIPMIGDPVAQAASPRQWNEQFKIDETDMICLPIHLKREGLKAFVNMVRNTENIPGFLSTIPHKSEIPSLCEIKSPEVEFLGVANTVRKNSDGSLECAMFDGVGMILAIKSTGCAIIDSSIIIIGCGAAGSAIALEALKQGASNIVVLDKDKALAERLSKNLKIAYPDRNVTATASASINYCVVINASPIGSHKDDMAPYPLDKLSKQAVVADAVTIPALTRWLEQAEKNGMKIVTGNDMARAQAKAMKQFIGII